MTGQASEVVWLISGRDFREHAFDAPDRSRDFLQALCPHSVPTKMLIAPEDTMISAPKCHACLIKYGAMVADQLGEGPIWPG